MTAKAEQRAALAKGSRKRQLETRTFFTWFQVLASPMTILNCLSVDRFFLFRLSGIDIIFSLFQDNLDPSQDDVAEVIKDDLW